MPRWRVDYIGKGGKHLGTVEAPDEKAAIAAAAKLFNITPARRFKIAVTRLEDQRAPRSKDDGPPKPPDPKMRIRGEGGHAWTLKGKCRFCGMTRVLFKLQNRPDCPWHTRPRRGRPKAGPPGNDKAVR